MESLQFFAVLLVYHLYFSTALLLMGNTLHPPLLVLLIDNAGGGIFQQLPVPAMSAEAFDDLFAMPQAVNPLALAAAHGVPGRQVAALEDLASALEWGLAQAGPALIRVRTDRSADADRRRALRSELQARTMAPLRDDPR